MTDDMSNRNFDALRQKAEQQLGTGPESFSDLEHGQFAKMLHDLQVHQVELEMQNEELMESRRQLELSRNKYLELFENAPLGYLLINDRQIVADANDTAMNLLEARRGNVVGRHCSFLVAEEARLVFFRHVQRVLEDAERVTAELRMQKKSGELMHAQIHSCLVHDELDGHPYCLVAFCDDSERHNAQQALEESEQRYRIVADYTYDWESWFDTDGAPLYVSPACERISGYPREVFISDPQFLRTIIVSDDLADWDAFMAGEHETASHDFRIIHKAGDVRWVSQTKRNIFAGDSKGLGVRFSIRDITRRKNMELQLRFQALHDPLTGLPNRLLCRDRIQHAVERSRRKGRSYSVIYLDIDKFKQVNDNLGHEAGDKLLVEVGKRLLGCVRGLDTVARFGGDEFVILLEEILSRKEALAVVMRVLDALRQPYLLQGTEVRSSGSLGIAHGHNGIADPEDVIRKANMAMHYAKEHGRDSFKVFSTRMQEAMQRVADLGAAMQGALNREEYGFVLQPIAGLHDLQVQGFEFLSRWHHPAKGTILPGDYIGAAEETGLIVELGRRVLSRACAAGAGWSRLFPGSGAPFVSVNVSRRELYSPKFVETVAACLKDSGMPPERLCLEFSESTAFEDEDRFAAHTHALKDLGVMLALDDFGKGSTSINSLKSNPFDLLKIDLSLAGRVDAGPAHLDSVQAIVKLAHGLGMRVVAEGVSSGKQLELLRDMGCDLGQGFYLAKPREQEESLRLLTNGLPVNA